MHHEDVGGRALAQQPGGGRQAAPRRSPAPRRRPAPGPPRPHDVVFTPATAPRSLRGHGTVHTDTAGDGGSSGPAATTRWSVSRRPRSGPRGAVPPVTVMRTRASGRGAVPSTPATALAEVVVRPAQLEAEGGGAGPEAGQVAGLGEGHAVDGLQGLEHAVTDGHARGRTRTARRRRRDEPAVQPHDLTGHRHAPDATASRRRALSSVSSHSSRGSLSQVMPPPVPRCSSPSSTQNVRMATLRSPQPRSASTQPTAPQYTPARHGLEPADVLEGRELRRAGHGPGRERGPDGLGPAAPGAEPPGHGRHEVHEAGVVLDGEQGRAPRPTRSRRPGRGRCGRGRRSSRSRPGPSPSGPPGSAPCP